MPDLQIKDGKVVYLDDSSPANTIYKLPTADGTTAQVIKTDGGGNLSFGDVGGTISISGSYGNSIIVNSAEDGGVSSNILHVDVANTRVGINDTTPSYSLDVNGTFRTTGNSILGDASGDSVTINAATIALANVAAGTDNTVLVYNGSSVVTDEIDSRVWGSTLVDGSGTANNITKWSDSNTVTNSLITDDGSTVTVGGNFTVTGTTTTVNTTNTTITDNLLELNSGASSNSNDSGIIIERGSTGDNGLFIWDESADKFALGTTTGTASSTGNITYTDAGLIAGSLDISGDAAFDTDTLFVDVSADRVGINDATPSYSLDVNGTGRITGVLRLDSNSANYGGAYDIYRSGAGYLRHRIADQTLSIGVTNTSDTVYYPIVIDTPNDVLKFSNEEGEMARFDTAGDFLVDTDTLYVDASADRVGINDATPSYSLDVNGTGRFTTSLRVGSIDIRQWSSSDSDIDGLITGSVAGEIIESRASHHLVVGIRGNDGGDSFSIISGGGNYDTDTTYDTLVAHFGADGKVGIGMESAGQVLEVAGAIKGAASANNGDAFYIGNDSKLVDIDVANIGALYGTSTTTEGGLKLGSGGPTLYGKSAFLGIGTTAPAHKLSVFGDSSGNRTEIGIDNIDQRLVLGAYFETGVTQYATIQSTNNAETGAQALALQPDGGNVGIGTASPAHKLEVNGDAVIGDDTTGNVKINSISGDSAVGSGNVHYTFNGNEGTGLRRVAANTLALDTAAVERLRIDSAGNVGIGTTPSSKLHVKSGDILIEGGTSGTSNKIIFKTTDNSDLSKYIRTNGYWMDIGVHNNEGLRVINNSGTNVFQVEGSGEVGIGTASPGVLLDVESATLGSTAGDEVSYFRATGMTGNSLNLDIKSIRRADGSDWSTTETRLQYDVDANASKKMWISFYNENSGTGDNTMRFGEGASTEWMRIDNGNLGIGATSIGDKLHVQGNAKVTGTVLVGSLKSGSASSLVTLSGGNSGGANIELYGESHASYANDAYYDADVHTFRSASGGTTYASMGSTISLSKTLEMNNNNITEVNSITINDPGPNEGLIFGGGNGWSIYESPDDLSTNSAGNLQFVDSGSRIFTLNTDGDGDFTGDLSVDGTIKGAAGSNSGDAFLIGNDSKLVDIDTSNIAGLQGTSNSAEGGLKLGSGGPTLYGKSGKLGIGTTTPAYMLDINDDTATGVGLRVLGGGSGGTLARFERDISVSGMFVDINCDSGDPQIRFTEASGVDWTIGVEGNVFEIVDGSNLTGTSKFEIDSTGDATIMGDLKLDATDASIQLKSGSGNGTNGAIHWTFNKDDGTVYGRIDLDYEYRTSQGLRMKSTGGYGLTLDSGNGISFREDGTEYAKFANTGTFMHNFTGTGFFPGLQNDTHGLMSEDQGANGNSLHVSRKGSTAANFARNTNNGTLIGFYSTAAGGTSAASLAGTIEIDSASTVSIQSSSDYRLKENIVSITDGIDRLMQMPVYRFNFIHDKDRVVDGFLAHEVQPHVPEAVKGEKDGIKVMGTRTVPKHQTMDQSKLVPLLTAALQEAITKIEENASEIATLKTQVAALTSNSPE